VERRPKQKYLVVIAKDVTKMTIRSSGEPGLTFQLFRAEVMMGGFNMSINAISGNLPVQQNEQGVSSAPNDAKQQNPVPADTVSISSAARAMQSPGSAGDVDHDGDSK
jgi:hypothetical protein